MAVQARNAQLQRVQTLFLCFVLYSVLGWCYEVFLEVVVYRWGFSNRGVLFGPYCVVYGFGALLLILSLSKLKAKRIAIGRICVTPLLVFVCVMLLTTAVELLASYLMEWTQGSWMWDYTRFHPNFQGRIALNPSLRFGVGGMVFLYVLQPLFERFIARLSDKLRTRISLVFVCVFAADILWTFVIR